MSGMKRRNFITLLGGAAATWPLAARAQRSKPTLMGLLGSGTAAAQSEWTAAFVQRLRELGWSEGRNLTIEYRWAEGRSERFAEIAAEFVRLSVDVIVTHNTLPPLAAKQATSVIPIVFATAGDPVGTGIVEGLARPGGNVTGLSSQHPDTAGKRLEILREIVPGFHRLAVLFEPGNPFSAVEFDGVSTAARTLGLELIPFEIRGAGEIAPAFESIRSRAQAIYVFPIQFCSSIEFASISWRWVRDCRPCTACGSTWKRGVCCLMDRTGRTCGAALPTWSIRFCAGRSQATFRSNSRPNSI